MTLYFSYYHSPLGRITLYGNEKSLTGLAFPSQTCVLDKDFIENDGPFEVAKQWLDTYFRGDKPDQLPVIEFEGSTFQKQVWSLLLQIPYGEVTTYNAIAKKIATMRGMNRMSAQAVGGAIAKNPIAILVPCHRVVGQNDNLTGYSGGIDVKIALLTIEGINVASFALPIVKKKHNR